MKNLKFFFVIALFSQEITQAQFRDCDKINLETVYESLFTCFGDDWFDIFSADPLNGMTFEVVTDTAGNIFNMKAFKYQGITKQEFTIFRSHMEMKYKICVSNPYSDISFKRHIELHKGKIPYIIIFVPSKFR